MLQLLSVVRCMRLPQRVVPTISNAPFRCMSDKCKKTGDKDKKADCKKKKEPECKPKKKEPDCKPKKKEPECETKKKETECKKEPVKPKEPVCKKEPEKPKESECKKKPEKPKEPECKKEPEKPKKDETAIAGGAKCKPKKPAPCPPPPKKRKLPKTCEEMILEREGLNKKGSCEKLTKVSGGGPKCPCPPSKRPPNSDKHSKRWGRISLMGVLPLVAILTVLVFTTHKEAERPEFKYYTHLYKRTKPFFWSDGNKSRFHNAHWNALPPDGYEDEIDGEAAGKVPETDKEREERLKEFSALQKEWTKMNDKRVAEAKKAEAAAEKEAKKAEADAEKEAKKLQAQAEKEEKKAQAEAEKERKKQEAEEKKRAKEEGKTQKVEYFFSSDNDKYDETDAPEE